MSGGVVSHPVLGELVKDGQFPWWIGRITRGEAKTELSIRTEKELDQLLLEGAAEFVRRLDDNEMRYRNQIASDIKTHDGDTVVLSGVNDVEQYMQRMTLNFIGYNDDGSFQLGYDDGGLFAGHLMNGYFTATEELEHSEIAG